MGSDEGTGITVTAAAKSRCSIARYKIGGDMKHVRWGIIGCGDVTEIKSGPGFAKAERSSLVAVMRRNGAKAEDYARHDERHSRSG